MIAGRVFLVLTGAFKFGHGLGGFTTNSIHSLAFDGGAENRVACDRRAGHNVVRWVLGARAELRQPLVAAMRPSVDGAEEP